jgi:GrpB-like predicted nucleotidyltransferase (UPF0157 family)
MSDPLGEALDRASMNAALTEDIKISPYDPSWAERFEKEKARLLSIFSASLLEIQHIGSTAVPGLDAKPIIDMIASVRSMEVADSLLRPLRDFGYVTPPDCNANLPERRWLLRHRGGHRTHHLHLVRQSSEGWLRTIAFRDILRKHPHEAAAYRALKIELARDSVSDRDQYIKGKTEFIEALLKKYK